MNPVDLMSDEVANQREQVVKNCAGHVMGMVAATLKHVAGSLAAKSGHMIKAHGDQDVNGASTTFQSMLVSDMIRSIIGRHYPDCWNESAIEKHVPPDSPFDEEQLRVDIRNAIRKELNQIWNGDLPNVEVGDEVDTSGVGSCTYSNSFRPRLCEKHRQQFVEAMAKRHAGPEDSVTLVNPGLLQEKD